jgi:uncharacterized protein (TIGR00299 family) protein
MTRIAYFDCFSGASGDMILGALVGAGAPLSAVERAVRGLGLRGVRVSVKPVHRAGFAATKFEVHVRTRKGEVEGGHHYTLPDRRGHGGHAHGHEHGHGHDHRFDHDHDHDYDHEMRHGVAAREILRRIQGGKLSARVKEQAAGVFERLANAEAKAHGTAVSRVHFHEVGAVDSIVDIVGACAALEALGVDEVRSSPLPMSQGHIHSAHGTIPVPAPATLEILKGLPVTHAHVSGELVTPTGAALLATLARGFGACPGMTIAAVGCGAGAREIPGRPNILRVVTGESAVKGGSDVVWVIESNIDDAPGEVIGHVMERLFRAGALDAFTTPVQMKKNRPGILLTALCPPSARAAVEGVIFRETTTFGVRRHLAERATLDRRWVEVRTRHGRVRVKVGSLAGRRLTASPEYEDCRAAAERTGAPLREVMRAAIAAYEKNNR